MTRLQENPGEHSEEEVLEMRFKPNNKIKGNAKEADKIEGDSEGVYKTCIYFYQCLVSFLICTLMCLWHVKMLC